MTGPAVLSSQDLCSPPAPASAAADSAATVPALARQALPGPRPALCLATAPPLRPFASCWTPLASPDWACPHLYLAVPAAPPSLLPAWPLPNPNPPAAAVDGWNGVPVVTLGGDLLGFPEEGDDDYHNWNDA